MRHVLSLIIGLVIAPLVWFAVGFGQVLLSHVHARFAQADPTQLVGPLALLAGAGLLYGLVATTRISPLGPIVAGLLFFGAQATGTLAPALLTGSLPFRVFGVRAELAALQPVPTGMALVLGTGLLMATFSFSRWRAPVKATPQDTLSAANPAVPGALTPAGAQQAGATSTPAGPWPEPQVAQRPADGQADGDSERTARLPQPSEAPTS